MDAQTPLLSAVPFRGPPARAAGPLRIAMIAPAWIPVPALGYGGIERVVLGLCTHLAAYGHDVTLVAAPGSSIPGVCIRSVLSHAYPDVIGEALYESDHAAGAMQIVDEAACAGTPFDVVHDHSGFALLAMADRLRTPVVHTVHGPFTDDVSAFYRRHGHKASLIALSETQRHTAPPGVPITAVIPNPVDVSEWPLQRQKAGYLFWLGRVDEVKAPDRAIRAALLADRPIVLAGPVQPGKERYFAEAVEPHLDGDRVCYVGEVAGAIKRRWLADAAALLMPITWEEPFGMVMVEALACGTPVIACPRGAAQEIVVDGVNGFLTADEAAMAAAVDRLPEIDPARCRQSVESRFDTRVVADAHLRVYAKAAARARRRPRAGVSMPVPG
jgi:glycosyltransferase involved in cell wall biosynthesis